MLILKSLKKAISHDGRLRHLLLALLKLKATQKKFDLMNFQVSKHRFIRGCIQRALQLGTGLSNSFALLCTCLLVIINLYNLSFLPRNDENFFPHDGQMKHFGSLH